MDDFDICKRIAEIEGKLKCYKHEYDGICVDENWKEMTFRTTFNPLTDDALCFRLMIKHEICLRHDYGDIPWVCTHNKVKGNLSRNKNPNKAICLAIIEVNKE